MSQLEDEDEGIELRMSANAKQLAVARTVAADIAMRQDFDLDSIEDLKLAVDETCSTLITLAAPKAVLSCRFAVAQDGAIRVAAQVPSNGSTPPDRESFGWRVLTALVDSVTTWVEPVTSGDGHVIHIDLAKRSAGTVDE